MFTMRMPLKNHTDRSIEILDLNGLQRDVSPRKLIFSKDSLAIKC